MEYLKAFLAGFASTLLFHQGLLALLHSAGATSYAAYSMQATAPLHVPQAFSLAFWGGAWAIALWLLLRRAGSAFAYWSLALVLGALVPSVVALFVIFPLKDLPLAGDWQPDVMVGALLLNAVWGLGVALLMHIFRDEEPQH